MNEQGKAILNSSIESGRDCTTRSQLDRLLALAAEREPVRTAIVRPCDAASLGGVFEAFRMGLILPVLVGSPAKIVAAAAAAGEDLAGIRMHIGNATGSVSGSTGDLVAPEYPRLRALLISLHQTERAMLGLPADPDLAAVAAATTRAQSIDLYDAGAVGEQQWNERVRAELILLRPDLRATAP